MIVLNGLISVIIPVFNTGEYLKECIDSVLKQTYKNLEIILVDDGSVDQSPSICDEYAENFSNIKVIHQENLGALNARKCGLKHAKGKYIGFIDSDDWINKDMYEVLYDAMIETKAKVVTSYICKEYEDRSVIIKDAVAPGVYNREDSNNSLYGNLLNCGSFTDGGIHASLCTKIFNKDILQYYIELVDDNINNGEDAATLYPILAFSDVVCITDHIFYHYRMRSSSITNKLDERYFERTNLLYLHLKSVLMKHEYSELYAHQLNWYLLNQIMTGLYRRYNFRNQPFYLFPFEYVNKQAKLILYGAGNVGQSYYNQIKDSSYCQLLLWVDREYEKYTSLGLPVHGLEEIKNIDADIIVIAIQNSYLADEIKNQLMNEGIDKSKLLWSEPKLLSNNLVIK